MPSDSQSEEITKSEKLGKELEKGIPLLTEGFLYHFASLFEEIEKELREIEESQALTAAEFQRAQDSLPAQEDLDKYAATFKKLPLYQAKLANIRTTMLTLLPRSRQLKQRASTLLDAKSVYEENMAETLKKEKELDKSIAAKATTTEVKVLSKAKKSRTKIKSGRKRDSDKNSSLSKNSGDS
ncbi:biogenesis of lysosome- organelles complex 1 subunit 6 [Basidiobolus ranarum]|uniref:Biogenesis of lysosome- organelles complex 1 subunit 6 n=1 Tax=Basidiobolus ranarum TaxID=34480 RepID=A0ABR2W4S7_9FUNG